MRTDIGLQHTQEWWFHILKENVAYVYYFFKEICMCKEEQSILAQNGGKREGIAKG